VKEGTAEAELLLHAARKLAGGPILEAGKPCQLQERMNAALPLLAPLSEQAAEEVCILEDGKRRVEVLAKPLWHIGDGRTDVAAVPAAAHVAAQDLHIARLDDAGAGDQG
jgi:hypothetical protein